MTDIGKQGLQFTLDWRASLLVLLLLPLLLSLGFWQLDRADEKTALQSLFSQRQAAGPVTFGALSTIADLRYQPVTLRGSYLNEKSFFLDNRMNKGSFGYEIITPFQPVGAKSLVLVNRGWVKGDVSRRSLPDIDSIIGEVDLSGEVYVPQGVPMRLGVDDNVGGTGVVQSIDIDELSPFFPNQLFPYVVRLSLGNPGSYQPNWVVVNLQPEKHIGYAVQWFAMSITLLIIAFLANTNCWALLKGRK